MPLEKAPLPIQFEGGIDTRTDSKQVPTTSLLDLQNCVFTKQTTLSKRTGYRALSTQIQNGGGDLANARGLAERDGEVILFTDKRCYSYRPSADRWANTGEVAATAATTLPIARTGSYQSQPDLAIRHGVSVYAWEDSRGGVWCSVIETATGRALQSQVQLDSSALARSPRCLAVGEVLHVLWTREDLGQIFLAVVNPATPATAPVVSILTGDLDATKPFFDAEPAVNAPSAAFAQRPAVIAWAQSGGGYRVGYLAPSGVLGSPATSLPSVATYTDILTGPISCAYDGSGRTVAVCWVSSLSPARAAVRFVDPANLTTVQRFNAALGGGATAYSRITCAFGALGTDAAPLLYWAAEVTATRSDLSAVDSGAAMQTAITLDTSSTRLRGHGLASRAWHDGADLGPTVANGDVYVLVAHTVRFFPYLAALRLSDDSGITTPGNSIMARLLPGTCAGSLMRATGPGTRAWTQHLPSVVATDLSDTALYGRVHAVPVVYRLQLSSQLGDQFAEQGIKLATIKFNVAYQAVQFGRGLYLASASPMHYDGDAWHEADFHCAPDLGFDTAGAPVALATIISSGGGGAIPNGTYVYAYWYEAVDAQGELHRGPVSVKALFTVSGGPLQVSHAIPTCRLTRFANVRVCVARTAQGATGTDTTLPLFKVTSNDVTVITGANRYINSDPTVDTVTFVDNLTDAQLTAREPLYTNGGILSNSPSAWGGDMIAVSKTRLFWNDSSDPLVVNYSQQRADDTALEAPIDLSLQVDPLGGAVTALAALDDTVLAFKEASIYVFGGPGPLANPAAAPEVNAFTPPELVTSDVGCTSPTSICATPVGITFQSAKGIMMLTRDRQIANIGNPAEAYDGQTVSRATLLPTNQRILYLTASGRTLLWDYNRNQWSTYTNHTGLDAVVVGGLYYYLRPDSRVFVETPGLYRDDNSRIPMVIDTAHIHFAQYLQGWQKVLYACFLGSFKSAHQLSIRYRIDYNDAWSPALIANVNADWNPSVYGAGAYGVGAYGGAGLGGTRYQRRFHLNRRCQAIAFRIEDIEATGDAGASFELSELLLIGGGIGADFKVGAARSG
jgi:hypothetical protein